MDRSRLLGLALAAGLFALSLAVRLPFLHNEPYGDENLHFVVAAHPKDPSPGYTDVWGNEVGAPKFLFWQRPLYYAAFHLPATLGFEAYRMAHATAASLLAPMGYLLLRTHGVRRPAAVLAGAALAVAPPLALWGAYAFMDVLMATALLGFLAAYRARKWPLVTATALAAIWLKETAYAAVLGLFLVDLVRALRNGRASLYPLRLEPREAALAWPLVVGPLPLAWAIAQGLLPPGGQAYGSTIDVAEILLPTVWLLPIVAAGLWLPRARFLSAASLATFGALVLLHASGRAVESWYGVPSIALAIVAAAATADAVATPRRLATLLPGAAAVALCAAFAFLPSGAAREALFPLTGKEKATLPQTVAFERDLRGKDLEGALDEVPWDEHPTILFEQNGWPWPFVRLAPASHVYADYPDVRRTFALDTAAAAGHIENTTTWTILGPGDSPFQQAVRDVYADCLVAAHGGWQVYQGAPCAGRAQALDDADRAHGGP